MSTGLKRLILLVQFRAILSHYRLLSQYVDRPKPAGTIFKKKEGLFSAVGSNIVSGSRVVKIVGAANVFFSAVWENIVSRKIKK